MKSSIHAIVRASGTEKYSIRQFWGALSPKKIDALPRPQSITNVMPSRNPICCDAISEALTIFSIARARRWYEQITTGESSKIAQLAGIDGVSPRFICMQMKLVQLSPQSIENIMTRPESLPLSLDDLLATIPMNWRKQSLGLSAKSA